MGRVLLGSTIFVSCQFSFRPLTLWWQSTEVVVVVKIASRHGQLSSIRCLRFPVFPGLDLDSEAPTNPTLTSQELVVPNSPPPRGASRSLSRGPHPEPRPRPVNRSPSGARAGLALSDNIAEEEYEHQHRGDGPDRTRAEQRGRSQVPTSATSIAATVTGPTPRPSLANRRASSSSFSYAAVVRGNTPPQSSFLDMDDRDSSLDHSRPVSQLPTPPPTEISTPKELDLDSCPSTPALEASTSTLPLAIPIPTPLNIPLDQFPIPSSPPLSSSSPRNSRRTSFSTSPSNGNRNNRRSGSAATTTTTRGLDAVVLGEEESRSRKSERRGSFNGNTLLGQRDQEKETWGMKSWCSATMTG